MAKVAIIANSTWNIYNFRMNILRALEAEGHDIVVIAPVDKYIFYLNEFKHVKHVSLKSLSRKSLNPFKDSLLFFEFYNILKNEKPDLVLNYTVKPNIYANLAASFLKIPSICVVTGLGYAFIKGGWLQSLTSFMYKFSFSSASKVVFENIDDRLLFEHEKIVAPSKCISIKGCGVNLAFFTPMPPLNKPENKTIFSFIGRFLHDKGVKEFVEAAKIIRKKYPNAEFRLIGEIDYNNPATVVEDELLQWVNEKVVVDRGPSNDVREEIRNSDCIIFPSYREAIARVLQEAMAMEIPVITTDVPGCREAVVHGENGFLVPVRNAEALADCVETFLSMSESERSEMGKRGRQKVSREFDENIISDFFVKLIQNTLVIRSKYVGTKTR
jgi:glycosyltransferase involved in cell wall biosynthesis